MLLPLALTALLAADPTPAPVEVQQAPAVTLLLQAHGGQEAVEGLAGLRFELSPFTHPEPTEAEPEPAPVAGDKLRLSVKLTGEGGRQMRLQQRAGDSDLVRITSGVDTKVWVGEAERQSAELAGEARGMAAQIYLVLDLVWGLTNGQINGEPSGRRRRDGVEYLTVRASFPANRGVNAIYLLYVHPKSDLVDRVDVFDAESLRRVSTIGFSAYSEGEGVRLPGRVDFRQRIRIPDPAGHPVP